LESVVSDRAGYSLSALKHVGDRITDSDPYLPAVFDFTPVVSDFSHTRSPLTSTFSGFTALAKTPAVQISYSAPSSPMSYAFTDGRIAVQLEGREWVSGSILLDMSDNSMLQGILETTTVVSQRAQIPGKNLSFPLTIFQDVLLEKISEGDYDEDAP